MSVGSKKKEKKTIPCHPNTPLFQQHETNPFNPETLLLLQPRHFTVSRPLPAMGRETATASLRETELPIFGRDLRSTMEIDLGEAEIDKLL